MKKLIAALAILCYCINITYAHSPGTPLTTADHILEERIHLLDAKVDMRLTNLVRTKIEEYTTYKRGAERLIKKSQLYFPIFERQLKKYNVPQEFKYLPIIESNLRTTIRSKAGAVGLWQFMKGTGQAYGLQIGALVDERMDPEKSTEAAAKYLHNLYQEFNDWTLVLAAYNSGAGNVRKAIRKAGSRSYWEFYGYLPNETRSYLPKFVAAAYLANYYELHDIDAQVVDSEMANTISAKIYEEISFQDISKASGTSIEMIETLNPEFIKGFIPKSAGNYTLTLPSKDMGAFLTKNYSAQIVMSSLPSTYVRNSQTTKSIKIRALSPLQIEPRNKVNITGDSEEHKYVTYKLSKRETLLHAARKAGITLKELLQANKLSGTGAQQLPRYILIPKN